MAKGRTSGAGLWSSVMFLSLSCFSVPFFFPLIPVVLTSQCHTLPPPPAQSSNALSSVSYRQFLHCSNEVICPTVNSYLTSLIEHRNSATALWSGLLNVKQPAVMLLLLTSGVWMKASWHADASRWFYIWLWQAVHLQIRNEHLHWNFMQNSWIFFFLSRINYSKRYFPAALFKNNNKLLQLDEIFAEHF